VSGGSEIPSGQAFGCWRFDAETGNLSDGTTTVRLEPQVARLLDYFLAHQETLISRDELMAAVWDNRVVSDDAVNRCISILRQKLSPGDRNAYIETVVRRGFISHFPPPPARVIPAQDSVHDSAPVVRQAIGSRRLAFGAAAVVAALALALFGALRMIGDPAGPVNIANRIGTPMVAVLPFVTEGFSGDSAFFANGMHDDLLTRLAQLESLRVISRTSVSEYRDSDMNIREIGRQLGADTILEGAVQRVGEQIRVNVQLIDAGSDVHLWAQQYNRELTPANIFDIQAEIARSIASAMHSTLTLQDAAQLKVVPTENMAAYRSYHEAMELRSTDTMAAPGYIAAMERAVALDPGFVRAWAELAGSLSYIHLQRQDPESIRRLEDVLERVRVIAPQSAEYLIAQSYYLYYVLKDHDRALELIRQAQKLRPSDPQVLELQSWIQRRQADIAGMIESVRRARTLDPREPYWTRRLVAGLMLAHRYDEAMMELDNAPIETLDLSVLRSVLWVREHRQPGRMLDDLTAMQREYDVEADPFQLWDAHIAAREFDSAAAVLSTMQTDDAWGSRGFPDIDLARIITRRFGDGNARDGSLLTELRAKLEDQDKAGVPDLEPGTYLVKAFVAAVEDDTAETERLIRTWFREVNRDLAELVIQRHHACRALGLAAAASAAVECLRSGLAEPSQVHPFLEPFLPYYDPIRNDPRYVEFLSEVQGG